MAIREDELREDRYTLQGTISKIIFEFMAQSSWYHSQQLVRVHDITSSVIDIVLTIWLTVKFSKPLQTLSDGVVERELKHLEVYLTSSLRKSVRVIACVVPDAQVEWNRKKLFDTSEF